MRAGLGAGLSLDTSAGRRSFGELALPIGFTFLHKIELFYRPMLSIPLGSETSPVFGGEREALPALASEDSGSRLTGILALLAIVLARTLHAVVQLLLSVHGQVAL